MFRSTPDDIASTIRRHWADSFSTRFVQLVTRYRNNTYMESNASYRQTELQDYYYYQ